MYLGVVFVATLAVSVILSSTATWGLTYSTSNGELKDMSSGFVELATNTVDGFRELVLQLIADSSTLVTGLLGTQYNRSMTQLNETETELLQTTLDLMNQTKTATAQSQRLVSDLVVSFGTFMQSAITDFTDVGTDDAARLRMEAALRVQLVFGEMLQSSAMAIKRTAQLYDFGMLNLSRTVDQPLDDGTCTLMAALCTASAEFGLTLYAGTAGGAKVKCNASDIVSNLVVDWGASADTFIYSYFPPYAAGTPGVDFPGWKQSCLASNASSTKGTTCLHGMGMVYPNYCNGTCGYDSRCRPWYTLHNTTEAPKTRMTDVYIDNTSGQPAVTLSYPIFSNGPSHLLAVTGTDFILSTVDMYLNTLSSTQLVAVVFNTSDLTVMGTSQMRDNITEGSSGRPIAVSSDPALRTLGGWLSVNRN
eukprot:EG_transcript_14133